MNRKPMSYKESGVDLEAADRAVSSIARMARTTYRQGVIGDVGGFGGLFALDASRYREPVLVSGTDGVGTKLRVAFELGVHHTVGIDLVAMCANDVAVMGAEPLFFLDYIAVGRLLPGVIEEILKGIAEGCRQAGCALIGGETAEMPGFYPEGEYELAGFCVGAVERSRLLDGSAVRPGDAVIGLASSGLHSNGYSLARRALARRSLMDRLDELGTTLGEEMLRPTRIYARSLLKLLEAAEVHAAAHITGGGIPGNLPRILPEGCRAVIRAGSWEVPPVFGIIAREGPVEPPEMFRTFNMGIGVVLLVDPDSADRALRALESRGERPYVIGEIVRGEKGVEITGEPSMRS